MRTRRLRVALVAGALALTTSGCGVGLQNLPKPSGVSGSTYTLNATFSNVVNLPADAPVRVGAFIIGYVASLKAVNYQAKVTLKIRADEKLPRNTTAQVRFDTPLGEDYVALLLPGSNAQVASASPNTSPFLAPGGTISTTQAAPSVEDVFAALGALLNGGGLGQLQTIITQLNAAFNGNQPQIHDLITQLDTAVSSFAQHTPQLDAALTSIGTLSQTLNAGQATIVAGINALAPAVSILQQNSQQLTDLVNNIANLSTVANKVVVETHNSLRETLLDLGPVLDQLVGVAGQLGPALNAITALEARTPAIAPGGYVQASITANVQVPPVPGTAPPLNKVTVDYPGNGIAQMLDGGLP
jgi:phospholipid/cholesterol/gamma-HCH transport system substrate-binding protein